MGDTTTPDDFARIFRTNKHDNYVSLRATNKEICENNNCQDSLRSTLVEFIKGIKETRREDSCEEAPLDVTEVDVFADEYEIPLNRRLVMTLNQILALRISSLDGGSGHERYLSELFEANSMGNGKWIIKRLGNTKHKK